jgi:hypothetical protein
MVYIIPLLLSFSNASLGYGILITMVFLIQLIPFLIVMPIFGLWAWMFRHMMMDPMPDTTRFVWILCFVFLSLPTAMYYYFTVYKPRHNDDTD